MDFFIRVPKLLKMRDVNEMNNLRKIYRYVLKYKIGWDILTFHVLFIKSVLRRQL